MKGYLPKFHYKFISAVPDAPWSEMEDMIKKINILSYENLCKVTDPNKSHHDKFLRVISQCNDFVSDVDGNHYGSCSNWATDRAIVIDSFSGFSDMAFGLVVGNKPVRAIPDYGIAQNAIKMFVNKLTSDLKCMVVVIAHIDREKDEITGGTTITVKTVGAKLGPDLPRMFSDVIRTKRNGDKFVWDTADTQATVVARHIPIAGNQPPSFGPLVDAWKKQGGRITATLEQRN